MQQLENPFTFIIMHTLFAFIIEFQTSFFFCIYFSMEIIQISIVCNDFVGAKYGWYVQILL
jgi:uncharacterized protein YqgC (DUF456 family)